MSLVINTAKCVVVLGRMNGKRSPFNVGGKLPGQACAWTIHSPLRYRGQGCFFFFLTFSKGFAKLWQKPFPMKTTIFMLLLLLFSCSREMISDPLMGRWYLDTWEVNGRVSSLNPYQRTSYLEFREGGSLLRYSCYLDGESVRADSSRGSWKAQGDSLTLSYLSWGSVPTVIFFAYRLERLSLTLLERENENRYRYVYVRH